MKAVVLAAGRGVRMRPITQDMPKAMAKLGGKPLIEWELGALSEAGIKEVAIVIGHRGELIRKKFGSSWKGVRITYIEQKEQLGTAHAVGLAREFAGGEHFMVLYCDVVVDSALIKRLMVVDELSPYEVLMVGRVVEDPWRYGVLSIEGSGVKEIVEKPAFGSEPSNIVNAGIYQFAPSIFEAIAKTQKSVRGEYELTDAIMILAKEGKAGFVGMCTGLCMDIGSIEELKEAEEKIKKKR